MQIIGGNLSRDPRIQELVTLIKMIDAKLNVNFQTIEDFKQLLAETSNEQAAHKDIQQMITTIDESFSEARKNLAEV